MYPDGPRTRRKRQTTIRCANVTCLLTAGCPHHTKPVTVFHRAVTLRFAITTHKWRLITSRIPKSTMDPDADSHRSASHPHSSLSRLRRRAGATTFPRAHGVAVGLLPRNSPVPPTRWGFARAEIARPVDAAERGGEKRHSRSRRAARTGTAVIKSTAR